MAHGELYCGTSVRAVLGSTPHLSEHYLAMRCATFACAEIMSNAVCIVLVMREGPAEPRLTSSFA